LQISKEIATSYLIVKLMHLFTATIVRKFLKALSKILQGMKKTDLKVQKKFIEKKIVNVPES